MSRLEKKAEWIKRRVRGKNGPGLKLGMGQGAPRALSNEFKNSEKGQSPTGPKPTFLVVVHR